MGEILGLYSSINVSLLGELLVEDKRIIDYKRLIRSSGGVTIIADIKKIKYLASIRDFKNLTPKEESIVSKCRWMNSLIWWDTGDVKKEDYKILRKKNRVSYILKYMDKEVDKILIGNIGHHNYSSLLKIKNKIIGISNVKADVSKINNKVLRNYMKALLYFYFVEDLTLLGKHRLKSLLDSMLFELDSRGLNPEYNISNYLAGNEYEESLAKFYILSTLKKI